MVHSSAGAHITSGSCPGNPLSSHCTLGHQQNGYQCPLQPHCQADVAAGLSSHGLICLMDPDTIELTIPNFKQSFCMLNAYAIKDTPLCLQSGCACKLNFKLSLAYNIS